MHQLNKKYRILFITHSYAMTGGAEDEFERLLKYFNSKKNEYIVNGLFPPGERSIIYSEYCVKSGNFKYGHLPVTNDGLLLYIKYFLKSIIQLFQLIKFSFGQKYDLAVINVVVLVWPVLAMRILGIKTVIFVREDIYPVWLRHFIYKLYYFIGVYLIPNSDTKYNDIVNVTATKQISRIYPAIEDLEAVSTDNLKSKLNDIQLKKLFDATTFKFINPARILNKKNQLLILEALKLLTIKHNASIPYVFFLGYYDFNDDYAKQINLYIENNSLNEYVIFLGEMGRSELYKIYQYIDSVIISSLSEGMPLVLVESFKFKKAFISTKVGGIPEIVKNEDTGLLVDFNPVDLCDKMIQIMNNNSLRDSIVNNAYSVYEKNFNLNSVMKNTETVFKKILDK